MEANYAPPENKRSVGSEAFGKASRLVGKLGVRDLPAGVDQRNVVGEALKVPEKS